MEVLGKNEVTYKIPAKINAGVFRTYDIRGEVSEDSISRHLAYAVGLAFASEALSMNQAKIIVGRDGRLSADDITTALIAGLRDAGCDVLDIGQVPTPLVYFATHCLDTNSGVMVTGSHNPKHHNGFKMVLAGTTLSTAGVQMIYTRIVERDLIFAQQRGDYATYDIIPDYINYVTEHIQLQRPLKVVLDCGNGIAGVLASRLFQALGCDVVELFCDVDGNFPNHHPDPTVPENLQDIIRVVQQEKADVGFAFDGDGDRLGLVTNKGEIIWPDRQLILFSQDILARNPGGKIIYDVKCTHHLADKIKQWGGLSIMYRTGHSLIKSKMLEEQALLAGEMSGHIFFNDEWFGFDDGLYVAARALRIFTATHKTSAELFSELPDSVNTPELKLPMDEEKKADFMHQLLTEAHFDEVDRTTIDGLRVDLGFGWGLVRPSNTSAYLVIRFEADTDENLERIKHLFRREMLRLDHNLVLPF